MTQLQYFVATVRAGSYTEAAQILFISPQAISKAIGDLEREFEISLLARGRKEVVLTSFGEVFYDKADDLVSNFTDLIDITHCQSQNPREQGRFKVAVVTSPLQGEIISHSVFDSFKKAFPAITLSLMGNSSGTCLAAFEENVVDAAIILGRTRKPGSRCIRLFSVTPRIALSKKHHLAKKESITIEDLRDARVVRPDDLRFCHQEIARQFKRRRCDFTYVDLQPLVKDYQEFFDSNNGVMFVTEDSTLDQLYSGIVVKPLDDHDKFHIPVCLVRSETQKDELLSCLEEYLIKATIVRPYPVQAAPKEELVFKTVKGKLEVG